MSKKHISALIIVFMGLVSFFLILNSNKKEGGNKDLITSLKSIKNSNPYLNFEARPQSTFSPSSAQISNNTLTQETNNLTDVLAQLYSQKIIQQNLNSDNNQEGIEVIPVEILTDQIIQERSEFSPKFLQFETKDVKIIYDNSVEKQLAYFRSLDALTRKNFGSLNKSIVEILDELIINQNFQFLQQYTNATSNQINDLLTLSTPSVLKIIHLQNINLLQKELTIYTALLNLYQDPLKGYLAFQQIPDLFEENLDLQTTLEQKFQEITK